MTPLAALSAAALLAALAVAQDPDVADAAAAPRLCVVVSVDQLAQWVFDAARPHLPRDGGFARLLAEGVEFADCRYAHACTETGPGHATIGTGVSARVHGIVRNQWWVRERAAKTYCVDEPMAPLDGWPEGKNRGAGLLRAPTLAAALEARDPRSVTVSVAWKDRSAILMAGGDADLAVWCESSTGRFVTNTAWSATPPAWLVAFNDGKPVEQWFGTDWERIGPAAAYQLLVDDRPYETPHGNGRKERTLPQRLTGGLEQPGPAYFAQVYASPFGNTAVRLCAEAAIGALDLGGDDVTDLLCVGFSSTDVMGHAFGPDSVEARDGLLRLDRDLALLLGALDREVGADRYDLFLTADHGVSPTPEWVRAQGVDAGRRVIQTFVGAAGERAVADALGAPPAGRKFLAHVGEWSIFLDDATLDAVRGPRTLADARTAAARALAAFAPKVPGIAAAYATADLVADGAGDDAIAQALLEALHDGRAGEVQLVVKPHWLDGTTPATHGSPHPYDRAVVGLAVGRGVPRGPVVTQPITPGFGAVWFAARLGLARPAAATDAVPAEFAQAR
ncbi:MAG: alkaline phosphatase family protein [Planctomycetota bacterium]